MNTKRTTLILAALLIGLGTGEAAAITIATVPIGNVGNANDPNTGSLYGGVSYNYSIGKYDVTVGQYTAFLNAVAATDTYNLYSGFMAGDLRIAGIAQNGSSGSYSYSVIGSANHPITYVSWGDAARFANWLHNGQPGLGGPAVPQNLASTEDGAYFLNGATIQEALADPTLTRKAGAQWFIPTENEWYKAAYYDPRTTAQGGPPANSHYWNYPTGTNTTPTSAPPGSTPNTANFYDNTTGFAVTGSTGSSSSQNYLTDVGAYTASASPYGTFDQGGDVFQWNEALISGSFRGLRGGSWNDASFRMQATYRIDNNPTFENDFFIGFRVATVPEPATFVLAGIGFLSLLTYIRQRRRRLPFCLNRPKASVI